MLLGKLRVFSFVALCMVLLGVGSEAQAQLPTGYTLLSGEVSEALWLMSVDENQFSEWKVERALAGVLCPLSIAQELQMTKFWANSKLGPAEKLNGFISDLSAALRPESGDAANCKEASICFCEMFSVIFGGNGSCTIRGGKGGFFQKPHAYVEASIPGIPGTIIIDPLNTIAYSRP
ncbi:MAG: hypothetical protein K1X79_00945 [Oligoflexia bacterium]|nr:hypothetical protein [Oligoflexia bacterium]